MKKLLLAVSMLFATSSFAGVLIEPQLGFKFAGSADTRAHGNNVAYKYSGVDIGGRLGYQMLGVMGGLNYNMSSFSKDAAGASISPTSATVDVDQTSIGVFVGYNLPILLRAWVAYNFSAEEKATKAVSNYSANGDKWSGTSTEIGVGFTGLPFLSLNLAYRMINYDEFYNASNSTTTTSNSYKPTEIALSVSLPFDI
jgi:hypothetical protein